MLLQVKLSLFADGRNIHSKTLSEQKVERFYTNNFTIHTYICMCVFQNKFTYCLEGSIRDSLSGAEPLKYQCRTSSCCPFSRCCSLLLLRVSSGHCSSSVMRELPQKWPHREFFLLFQFATCLAFTFFFVSILHMDILLRILHKKLLRWKFLQTKILQNKITHMQLKNSI